MSDESSGRFCYTYCKNFSKAFSGRGFLLIHVILNHLKGIVYKCCQFLKTKFHSSNCVGLRRYAQFYFCKGLEEAALNYILQNFESIIMEKYKDEFLELTADEFSELLSYDELNIRRDKNYARIIIFLVGSFESYFSKVHNEGCSRLSQK